MRTLTRRDHPKGELTDHDKLVYVNNVIKGKLLESETLRQQAASNSKEQFANSPDLNSELTNTIIGALDAHTLMSTPASNSPSIQKGRNVISRRQPNLLPFHEEGMVASMIVRVAHQHIEHEPGETPSRLS